MERFIFRSPVRALVIGVNVNRIRIGIVGRDAFWCNAVVVEWEHQYPDRKLFAEADACYLIEADWLDDLEVVAQECFSRIVVAPADPSRRSWLRRFVPIRNNNKV